MSDWNAKYKYLVETRCKAETASSKETTVFSLARFSICVPSARRVRHPFGGHHYLLALPETYGLWTSMIREE